MHDTRTEVTSLLSAVGNGDAGAADRLIRLVYDELHRVAHVRVAREGRNGDLQTTVLVQEAYLRLLGGDGVVLARRNAAFAANGKRHAPRRFRRRTQEKENQGRRLTLLRCRGKNAEMSKSTAVAGSGTMVAFVRNSKLP